jgi:F0F1-type ATP synthase gamma subunit
MAAMEGAIRNAHTDVVNILARIADGARVEQITRWLTELAADLAKQVELF